MTDDPDILARNAEGRRELAKLDFWEKVRRMEALRERLRGLKKMREQDRLAHTRHAGRTSADP